MTLRSGPQGLVILLEIEDGAQDDVSEDDPIPMVNLLKTPERQLRSLRADPEGRRECEHSHMEATHVSGIERLVCEVCGHVSIKAAAPSVTKGLPGSSE